MEFTIRRNEDGYIKKALIYPDISIEQGSIVKAADDLCGFSKPYYYRYCINSERKLYVDITDAFSGHDSAEQEKVLSACMERVRQDVKEVITQAERVKLYMKVLDRANLLTFMQKAVK